jgi:hypothetical protein
MTVVARVARMGSVRTDEERGLAIEIRAYCDACDTVFMMPDLETDPNLDEPWVADSRREINIPIVPEPKKEIPKSKLN